MRYTRIYTHIFKDEKFMGLPEDGRNLFIYLLISPHSNSLGVYSLPKIYIAHDLRWDMARLEKAFTALLSMGLVFYDESMELVLVKNQLKYNPIENHNQAKAALKILKGLPKSNLFEKLSMHLKEPYHKLLIDFVYEVLNGLLNGYSNGLGNGYPNKEQKKEQNQDQDKDAKSTERLI